MIHNIPADASDAIVSSLCLAQGSIVWLDAQIGVELPINPTWI